MARKDYVKTNFFGYPDGNSALEEFHIAGKSIIELIDEIEDCEPV